MDTIKVYLEIGKKRTFAGAIDWPGWCRNGREEASALQALVDYGPRYGRVLHAAEIEFQPPADASALVVANRLAGNATTDFGAPAIMPEADTEPINQMELGRYRQLLMASWRAFDDAARRAAGKTLRKGPRGGGRDLEKMRRHVLEADLQYLKRLAWKQKRAADMELVDEIKQTREAMLSALATAVNGELPSQGPRGGKIWPPRYFMRRVVWHVLDHAWEIEDRIDEGG